MTNALLEGLKVLDLGVLAAGPYCAKLMADAGADVIHVERPGRGDPSRALGPFAPDDTEHRLSATFAFLNANKRSVTLDFATAEGAAALWDLVGWADILVENFRPGTLARHGFGTDALLARNPALVQVSITNYGQNGPYRDHAATELTLQAMAGMMDGNGDQDREPLRYPGLLTQYMAGANASYAALTARRHARRTGRGQQVDVSIQESVATTYYSLYADYQYTGALHARGQKDLYPTADGLMMARWGPSRTWDEFVVAVDAPELAVDPALQPPLGMIQNSQHLAEVLSERLQTRTRREWFARMLDHGMTAGMLQSIDEVLACPHLEARSFYDGLTAPSGRTTAFPGVPYAVDGQRRHFDRTAPALGEHNDEVYGGLLGYAPERIATLRAQGAI
jgi:crotonobetainyl-CoA:carnitine CoA-transferase CaiB-like acyl-CoA transferase